jgi:hypothetical protein
LCLLAGATPPAQDLSTLSTNALLRFLCLLMNFSDEGHLILQLSFM